MSTLRQDVFEEGQNDCPACKAKRTSVKLDKPIYTGFTVLELSKLHMYDFHYIHIMKKYGPEKAKLKTLTHKTDKNLNGLQSSLTSLSSCFGRFKLRLKVSCNSKRASG